MILSRITNAIALRGLYGTAHGCMAGTGPRTIAMKPMHLNTEFERAVSNENDYIYKHIHSSLVDRFSNIVKMAPNLSIYPSIMKLSTVSKDKSLLARTLPDLRTHIQTMNQIELAALLYSIKDKDTFEYRIIKRMIDHEMRWLLKEHVKTRLMDLDLWFYIADIFYESQVRSKFASVLINYLAEDNIEMSNRQMLHLLFLIVLRRDGQDILEKFEQRIFGLLDRATFEDIAIICLAFFKTSTIIRNPELLKKIVDKTTDNLCSIDPAQPGYCSVIKSLRYSRCTDCRESVNHLVMSLTNNLDGKIIFASPFNAVHTVKLMESYRVYDSKIIHMLRLSMFQNLDDYRIKDIQYALTSIANFAYMDLRLDDDLKADFDRLSREIVAESRSDVEFQHYHVVALARTMAIFGYYNDELMDYINQTIANPKKYEQMRSTLEFDKSCLLLYVASKLEGGKVKLYNEQMIFRDMAAEVRRTGNFGSIKQDMSLQHLSFILRSSNSPNLVHSSMFRDIAKSLASTEELKGPEYKFNFQYTLPHQNYADLIISKDRPAPGMFNSHNLMPQPIGKGERHCLVFALHKTDYVDGYQRLCGYKRLMTRLLVKLNYNVIQADMMRPDISLTSQKIKRFLDQE